MANVSPAARAEGLASGETFSAQSSVSPGELQDLGCAWDRGSRPGGHARGAACSVARPAFGYRVLAAGLFLQGAGDPRRLFADRLVSDGVRPSAFVCGQQGVEGGLRFAGLGKAGAAALPSPIRCCSSRRSIRRAIPRSIIKSRHPASGFLRRPRSPGAWHPPARAPPPPEPALPSCRGAARLVCGHGDWRRALLLCRPSSHDVTDRSAFDLPPGRKLAADGDATAHAGDDGRGHDLSYRADLLRTCSLRFLGHARFA